MFIVFFGFALIESFGLSEPSLLQFYQRKYWYAMMTMVPPRALRSLSPLDSVWHQCRLATRVILLFPALKKTAKKQKARTNCYFFEVLFTLSGATKKWAVLWRQYSTLQSLPRQHVLLVRAATASRTLFKSLYSSLPCWYIQSVCRHLTRKTSGATATLW